MSEDLWREILRLLLQLPDVDPTAPRFVEEFLLRYVPRDEVVKILQEIKAFPVYYVNMHNLESYLERISELPE